MKVRAAVVRARHAPMSLEDLVLEDPQPDEIIVRIVATGVCHTDMAMRDQVYPVPQPIVLGHEGAGIVERIGRSVTKVKPGDSVVMTYNSCGQCPSCYSARASYCYDFFGRNFGGSRPDGSSTLQANGQPVHGYFFAQSSFSTHALCRERNVVKVPEAAPLKMLGPIACGIQTGAGAVMNALRVEQGQSILVVGTGSVGMSAIMAARIVGATTIVGVDLNDERLALARELGATHTFNARTADLSVEMRKILPHGVNYALDTTGSAKVIRQAVDLLAPRGVCGLLGSSDPTAEMALNVAHIMTAGRTVRGIIEGESVPDLFIPALVDLYMQGRFPIDRLMRFYPFEQINQAIDDSEHARTIKAVVEMPN